MPEPSASAPTLWDRVEHFLKNQPWAVVTLLFVVFLGGFKTVVEGADAFVQAYRTFRPVADPRTSYVLSCSQLGHLPSASSSEPEHLVMYVTNSSNPTPLELTWVDQQGQPDPTIRLSVARGAYLEQQTYAGHVWLVSDASHPCLGLVKLGSRRVHLDQPHPGGKPTLSPIIAPD